jgi:sterol-4alpha-carboxylate 3-dehydrogenase (decarboxylating)
VNVDGTKAVIDAAVSRGVRKLVFTSSAGVVFNGADLVNVDERLPPPEKAMDAYNESKAKAEELVLAANGKGGLLTVALRPAGIFGYVSCFAIIPRHRIYTSTGPATGR